MMDSTHTGDIGGEGLAQTLEARDDVARAVDTWDDCDVAVLVEDGTDVAPIREGLNVVGVTDFGAAPYTLFKFNGGAN